MAKKFQQCCTAYVKAIDILDWPQTSFSTLDEAKRTRGGGKKFTKSYFFAREIIYPLMFILVNLSMDSPTLMMSSAVLIMRVRIVQLRNY